MFILRLWGTMIVCTCVVGCAVGGLDRVPDGDWQGVPARERSALDRASDTELAKAKADVAGARTALADAQHMLATQTKQVVKPLPATADDWFKDREPQRKEAAARADQARDAWLRANVAWRQHRLDAATARLAVIAADRELTRAKAIDRHLLGDDTYDTAMYRGQLARAQEPWYRAELAADATRAELEHLGAKMASTKEAYAQMMRTTAPGEPSGRFELPRWTTDVPRHGLKYATKTPIIARPAPRYLVLRR